VEEWKNGMMEEKSEEVERSKGLRVEEGRMLTLFTL